jgi:DNA repair protein SbcC/Rad50
VRPLELRLKGLRSWSSERTVDFSDLGLFAIVGETGAGKSSLLEAIVYALYNASTFSARDVRALIADGQQTMSVSLEFEADGERWRVTRSTSRGSYPPSTHKLNCLSDSDEPPLESESSVKQRIEALVGLDYKGFTSAVLLPQGRLQTLLIATEGERSSILKGIFRLDELDRVRESADSLRRSLELPLEELSNARAALLPEPAATAAEQAATLEHVSAILVQMRDLRKHYEAAAEQVTERTATAEQAAKQAAQLRRQQGVVPGLDDALAAEAELTAQAEPLADERTRQTAARDEARATLTAAAQDGEGLDQLAEACPRLRDAAEQLPQRQLTAERIATERQDLATHEEELNTEVEAIGAARQKLKGQTADRAALAAAADLAERDHEAAASALVVARQRGEALAAREGALGLAEQAERAQQRAAAEAGDVESAASQQLTRARERFEELRRKDSAAAAATGLGSGDACPVCSRELPDRFSPPVAPDLEAAHAELHQAEESHQDAARAAAGASASATAAESRVRSEREALGEAERELKASETTLATTRLVAPNLATPDEQLLAPLLEAARAGRQAVSQADADAAAAQAELAARTRELEKARESQIQIDERLQREQRESEAAIARHREALSALPARFRPGGERPEDLAVARDTALARLNELRDLRDRQDAAASALEQAEAATRELAREREARVLEPRRQAAGEVAALRVLLESLEPPIAIADPPAEQAALSEHAVWISRSVAAADVAASQLEARQRELITEAASAQEQGQALLADADPLDPEHCINDAASLREALEDWGARERAAEALREQAESQVEQAKLLDERSETLGRLRRACDEVARLLADGKFIRWMVERRQHALLEVASDRFREISSDRYGFAQDFQVVDRRTGAPRSAKTLSGGETFQASLALGLGMIELAARSGGRIDSFYLDEGFGSLDPNALDDALSALEQRAQSGQLIGVISHVAAVADRLETVLRVSAGPDGSRIERLDPAQRAEMLEAELAQAGR